MGMNQIKTSFWLVGSSYGKTKQSKKPKFFMDFLQCEKNFLSDLNCIQKKIMKFQMLLENY